MSLAENYDKAFFEAQAAGSLQSARVVLGEILPLVRPRRIVDIGCGVGSWLRAAREHGVPEVVGIDGDYVDRAALLIEDHCFIPADLETVDLATFFSSRSFGPFDMAICLEVAEHLSFARAPSLVAGLAALSDVVLFSAAVPFQYGEHHVNEQWPEFWAILFRDQGFICFDPLRDRLWGDGTVDWWYAQNTLLFVREGSPLARTLPQEQRASAKGLARVHPQNLLTNVLALPRRYRLDASAEEFADFSTVQTAYATGTRHLPSLSAPARAAATEEGSRATFPWTRLETYHPEQEIADLHAEVARLNHRVWEVGEYLRSAEASYAAAQRQIADHGRARLEALSRLNEANDHIQYQHGLVDELRLQIYTVGEELRAREARVAELEVAAADRQRLEQEVGRLLAEMAALQSSATWQDGLRVAAWRRRIPRSLVRGLRVARRLLRGPRRQTPSMASAASLPGDAGLQLTASSPTQEPAAVSDSDVDTSSWAEAGSALICKFNKPYGRVSRATLSKGMSRLRRFELFDETDYLTRNEDVKESGLDAFTHFLQAGALEERGRTEPEELARVMGSVLLLEHAAQAEPQVRDDYAHLPDLVRDVGPIGIFVNSRGNLFMADIAEDLARDLRAVGADVQVLDENSGVDDRPGVSLFVAPHEFFTLGDGPRWIRDDVIWQGFMFGTEQVQTKWFQLSLPFILMSAGVLDICAQTAQLFGKTGLPALHLLPGCSFEPFGLTEADRRHPLFRVLPPAAQRDPKAPTPFMERPLDIAFFGNSSEKRDRFFGRNAAFFAEFDTVLYNRRAERGPLLGRGEEEALSRLAAHVSGHAKITLNIHREDFGYFEWHRMVRLGMCAGSVVVSDPCLPHPDFIAGTHYFQEQTRHIPDLLEWLLRSEDGRRAAERVRANVDDLLTHYFDTRHTAAAMLRFLGQHKARG
ncbi:methyltransferase domain-containing protein [Acidisoma sp. 7E03]